VGEGRRSFFEASFNRSIKVQGGDDRLTSDGGAVLLRERIYGLTLGYRTQDDLDRLALDPALRMATWDRPGQRVLEERLANMTALRISGTGGVRVCSAFSAFVGHAVAFLVVLIDGRE